MTNKCCRRVRGSSRASAERTIVGTHRPFGVQAGRGWRRWWPGFAVFVAEPGELAPDRVPALEPQRRQPHDEYLRFHPLLWDIVAQVVTVQGRDIHAGADLLERLGDPMEWPLVLGWRERDVVVGGHDGLALG